MIKKIISIAFFACILVLNSCNKSDSLLQEPQVSTLETTPSNGPLKAAAVTGWVMQPTWNYTSVASKTFSVGNLGLVVSAMNTGTGTVQVYIQQRDASNSIITENVLVVVPNDTKVFSTIPSLALRSVLVTIVRTSPTGTVIGSIIVNSKY